MLSNSIIAQKKHSSFLFQTDLESDDNVSELQFSLFLKELASKTDAKEINIAFVVGEGNSALKVRRQEKMLASLKAIGLLKKCNIQIIRGYNDYSGAQKDFKTEGQESLSPHEIDSILKTEAESKGKNKDYETELRTMAQTEIIAFLTAHPNTAIINLKPPRELIDISKANASQELLAQHVFYGTGSYNHRALFDPKRKGEGQKELLTLLRQFKETFIFETYFGHETNSTSMKNSAKLFELLETTKPGEPLYFLAKFIDLWGEHLLAADRLDLPNYLTDLLDAKQIDQNQKGAIQALVNGKRADVTSKQFSQYKTMLKSLAAELTGQETILKSVQKVDRILGKWANITECARQFVNADPAWTAIIFGNCSRTSFNMAKTEMSFNGDYTVLSEAKDESQKIHICLPGMFSVAQYNSLRKEEKDSGEKPSALQEAQTTLFEEIQKDLLNTVQTIYAAKPNIRFSTSLLYEEEVIYDSTKSQKLKHYDVIISGCGPTALAVAWEALNQGKSVLIISNRIDDFVRTQMIRIKLKVKDYFVNILKENKEALDHPFVKNLYHSPVVAIKDVERFLQDRLKRFTQLDYSFQSSLATIDLGKGTLSVHSEATSSEAMYTFKHFVAADGVHHHAATVFMQNAANNECKLKYDTVYEDKQHHHAGIYAVVSRADGLELAVPNKHLLGVKDNKSEHVSFIFLNQASHDKHERKTIKCSIGGIVPEAVKMADNAALKKYFGDLINKAFREKRLNNGKADLVVDIPDDSKKHGIAKDNLKMARWGVKIEMANKAAMCINNNVFIIAGDAFVSPFYFYGDGFERGFENARGCRAIFENLTTENIANYNKTCQEQTVKIQSTTKTVNSIIDYEINSVFGISSGFFKSLSKKYSKDFLIWVSEKSVADEHVEFVKSEKLQKRS